MCFLMRDLLTLGTNLFDLVFSRVGYFPFKELDLELYLGLNLAIYRRSKSILCLLVRFEQSITTQSTKFTILLCSTRRICMQVLSPIYTISFSINKKYIPLEMLGILRLRRSNRDPQESKSMLGYYHRDSRKETDKKCQLGMTIFILSRIEHLEEI